MQRLWAPWRMEYIGGEQRPGCLFCRVIADPYDPGHAMVAPVAHVATLEDLDDGATTDLMRAVRRTLTVLRESMSPDGINAGVNIGRAAGAGIPDHVHFHLVPRWNGDTNFMAVIDDVKIVNEALTQTSAKLRRAFAAT